MSRRLKLTLFPLLFIAAAVFAGGSVGFALLNETLVTTSTIAGSTVTHTVSFNTEAGGAGDEVVINYSAYGVGASNGFNLSGVTIGGTSFLGFTINPDTVTVDNVAKTLSFTGGTFIVSPPALSLTITNVVNPTVTSVLNDISINTLSGGSPVDGGSIDDEPIQPAALDHFTFITSPPDPTTAGANFQIVVEARDQYENRCDAGTNVFNGTVTASDFTGSISPTPSDNFVSGLLNQSDFQITATRTNNRVIVESGAATGLSNAFDVDPGALNSYTISGEPGTTVAGAAFSSNIDVTAYDVYDNVKTDHAGNVLFSSTDGAATLPAAAPLVNGTQTFAGTGFTLETAGVQTITVEDEATQTISATTSAITVTADVIDSFTLDDPGTVVAGQSFSLSVSGAVDAGGNPASGTVSISFVGSTDNTDISPPPSSATPTYTDIPVVNGSGSAPQTLVNADTVVVLRGTVGAVTDDTDGADAFDVDPGALNSYTISGEPGTTVAGAAFSSNIDVTAYDVYDNVKTDHAGNVLFSSTDGAATLPAAAPLVNGTQTFAGTGFTLETAGVQTITVEDEATQTISATTSAITVTADVIDSFTLTAPANPVAGEFFSLGVTGAVDSFDNPANGTINISFTDGQPHRAPDGTDPILANISVVNGSGSASQTLVLAEGPVTNMFTGRDIATLVTATSGAVTVNYDDLHHFTFNSPTVDQNTATEAPFAIDIEAHDTFNNRVTSYDGADIASISDNTGTIYEDPTPGDVDISFTLGVYNGNAVINLERFNNVITVTDNPGAPGTGSETGTSNPFNVIGSTVPVSLDLLRAPKSALTVETGVEMMEITIYNVHPINPIILSSIDVWVESSSNSVSETVIPSTLISSMSVDGNTNNNPPNSLTFVSVPVTDTILPLQSRSYTITIDVAPDISNAVIPNLQLRLADVKGLRSGGQIIPVNLDSGEPLNTPDGFIRSNITNISVSRDEASYTYPNPFNPMKQRTNIVYYSNNQGTTTIKILTITGRLVRTISDATSIGSNEALWDGKNGRGQIVLNGVYVAVIMTPDGSKQTVKIAVVK